MTGNPSNLDTGKVEKSKSQQLVNGRYDAEDIKVLKGLEGVRRRPAMYIGDTGTKGLHHLIFEVLDNSVDEAIAGFADYIKVTFFEDGSVQIKDNGRGIPVDNHKEYGKPAVEVIMEHLHSGGKFDNKSYKISGGLHGVGLSVVNALAEWLVVEINRDGQCYKQRFAKGYKASEPETIPCDEDQHGTLIRFFPDSEIFTFDSEEEETFNFDTIANRMRELAFLTPQAKFEIYNRITEEREVFHYEGGLKEFIKHLNQDKKTLHNQIIHIQDNFEEKGDVVEIEIAMQYTQGYQTNLLTYCNTINTIEGGTHLTGFKSALTRTLNSYVEEYMAKKYQKHSLSGSDTREGLSAVISIKLPDPQFESQTKIKLGNPEARQAVSQVLSDELTKFLEQNPDVGQKIVKKSIDAKKAREAAKKARQLIRRKSALDNARMPGKLADCSSSNPEECEIFIVEGDSAGGSAKQGRDRTYQAILPIRGKILNVEKARIDRILRNNEIQAIIKALGVGIQGVSEEDFDIEKLRYHKVIIFCDADVDGAHIETLLLTFFFRYMRPLIDNGNLYVAAPPLYKLSYRSTEQYVYTDKQRDKLMEEIVDKYNLEDRSSIKIKRYKGLGEMSPDELYRTTMNKETRILKRVVYEDHLETDQTFTRLMGKEVTPRKKFIINNYDEVNILDI
ncbi:MAG: DNA topoisomerase (ATP-hydrolyzing) subunit B [Candidatus Lokiarchaeota archaeon]|nr:DNA topoisomerase (ATP-hydrolyzing) subunit B [Candidatus Lokiarchaeota archaeon]